MARRYEIYYAFSDSVKSREPRGRTVKLSEFVQHLARYNHHWTMSQAAQWMERYQPYFRVSLEHDNGDRDYFLMNMGRVMGGQ